MNERTSQLTWAASHRRAIVLIGATIAATLLLSGSAGAIIYTPSSLTFANQNVGTTSPLQQVNVGGGSCGPDFFDGMNIQPGPCVTEATDIAVSGPFVITSNTCPAQLKSPFASMLSCTVAVASSPVSIGPQTGFLRLTSSPSIVGVPLSGTGCKKVRGGKLQCAAKKKKKRKKRKR